jgi:hypothetical protein
MDERQTVEGDPMLWVTRSHIRVNRAATGWLIRRFIDPEARFCFVEPAEVAWIQRECSAIGFDAPGARYPHKDAGGRCSFEALVDQYHPYDGVLRALARIVHCADFPQDGPRHHLTEAASLDTVSLVQQQEQTPGGHADAVGLRTISRGFPLVATDDHETLDRCAFLYDALYASLQERFG